MEDFNYDDDNGADIPKNEKPDKVKDEKSDKAKNDGSLDYYQRLISPEGNSESAYDRRIRGYHRNTDDVFRVKSPTNDCSRPVVIDTSKTNAPKADILNDPSFEGIFLTRKDLIKQLEEKGPKNLLLMAAKYGIIRNVRIIVPYTISYGFKEELNESLCRACEEGHTEIVEFLLNNGANAHYNEEMPLRVTIENGHADILTLLMVYDANIHYYNDFLCVLCCESGDYPELLEIMIGAGVDISRYYATILQICFDRGHVKSTELLIKMEQPTLPIKKVTKDDNIDDFMLEVEIDTFNESQELVESIELQEIPKKEARNDRLEGLELVTVIHEVPLGTKLTYIDTDDKIRTGILHNNKNADVSIILKDTHTWAVDTQKHVFYREPAEKIE